MKAINTTIIFALIGASLILSGCAALYHVNVGEIDNRNQFNLRPIEFKVSETGVDLNDVKTLSNVFMRSDHAKQSNDALEAVQYFQMGPQTGMPVYNLSYSEKLNQKLKALCPTGRVTGIQSVREMRKYPVISGEIIKVTAFCMEPKS